MYECMCMYVCVCVCVCVCACMYVGRHACMNVCMLIVNFSNSLDCVYILIASQLRLSYILIL